MNIPDGVTKIGQQAFYNCKQLQSVTLPQTLKEISSGSFCETSLKSIEIPNGVTKIGERDFGGCRQLQSVMLPKTLQEIDDFSFLFCTSLKSIIIPESVTRIGKGTFKKCFKLQVIALPKLATIDCDAFKRCEMLDRSTSQILLIGSKDALMKCLFINCVTVSMRREDITCH